MFGKRLPWVAMTITMTLILIGIVNIDTDTERQLQDRAKRWRYDELGPWPDPEEVRFPRMKNK